jgi:hypothetical protein
MSITDAIRTHNRLSGEYLVCIQSIVDANEDYLLKVRKTSCDEIYFYAKFIRREKHVNPNEYVLKI